MYSPVQTHKKWDITRAAKKWEWSTRIREDKEDKEDEEDEADKKDEKMIKLSIDQSYLISGDKLYLVKKVIKWLKLSSDISYQVIKVIKW